MLRFTHAAHLRAALLSLVATAACSSSATGENVSSGNFDAAASSDDDGSSDADEEGDETAGSNGVGTSAPPDTSDEGGDTSEGDDDTGPPATPGDHAGCPTPLPGDWLFCEDFETIADPSEVFFEYQDADGAFVLDEGGAASGLRAMKATYHPDKESAGWLSVALGRNPIVYGNSPQVAMDGDFTSVYWRLRVKMEAGWPDLGPGQLTSATSFASSDWEQALVARLRSDGNDVVLLAEPLSCIVGDQLVCSGFDDTGRQQELGGLVGAMPLFSESSSGEWHCVEAHVALNTPELADGVFEFWIDDELQNESHTLDWRGGWGEYGINLVTVQNLWYGGAPEELSRWIDDVVISTERIGCE